MSKHKGDSKGVLNFKLIFLMFFALAFIIIGIWGAIRYEIDSKTINETIMGTVVDVEDKYIESYNHSYEHRCEVTVTYTVNNIEYTVYGSTSHNMAVGDKMLVYFESGNPSNSRLLPAESNINILWIGLITGVPLLAYCIYSLVRINKTKPKKRRHSSIASTRKRVSRKNALWLIFVVMGFVPLCLGIFCLTKDGIIPLKEYVEGAVTASEYIEPIDNTVYNRYAVKVFYTVDDVVYTYETNSFRARPEEAEVDSRVFVYYNKLFPQIATLDSSKCGPDEDSTAIGFLSLLMGIAFIVLPLIAFFNPRGKEHIKSLPRTSDDDELQ